MTRGAGSAAEATRGGIVRLLAEGAVRGMRMGTGFLLMVGLGASGFGLWAALWGVAGLIGEAADLGLRLAACPAIVASRITVSEVVDAKVRVLGASFLTLLMAAGLSRLVFPETPAGLVLALLALTLAAMLVTAAELSGVLLRALGRRLEEAVVLLVLAGGALCGVALALSAPDRGLPWSRLIDIGVAQAVAAVLAVTLAAWWLVHADRPAGPASWAGVRGPTSMRQDENPISTRRALLAESLPLGLNGALALATLRVEIVLLFVWRGPLETGLFAAALKLLELLNAMPGALAAGALPALTREAARAEGGARLRTAATVMLLAIPAALGLCLLAPQVAARVGYAGATVPLRVLALAVVPMFLNAVALHALLAAGFSRLLPRLTAVRLLAGAALGLVLIPRFGGAGAALGLATSEWLLLALALRAAAAAGVGIPLSMLLVRHLPARALVAEGAHAR